VIGFSPALDLLSSVDYLPLLTTRGCPYSCSYCASKRISPPFTRRPLDETLAEIESAIRMYGIRDIALYDDSFLFHAQEHALPLLRASAERFPGVRWHSPNGLHASCIDAEVAAVMKKAGFKTIRLGLERTQDGFHSRTGGKITPAGFLKAVRHLREAGFSQRRIGAYLLVGLPGQTPEDVLEDVEIVLDAGAHPKLAEYSPIPGTGMWDEATQDGEHGFMHEPLLQNCTLLSAGGQGVDSEFIQALRVRISREMGALNPEEE
jgi:radical SAM superfamily enzyme YgiQ (UPF0313 family)